MNHSIFYKISRWILAALFIFSGVTKAINPFGLSIQLEEYLSAMGLHFLQPLAGIGGIMLPSVEILLGFMIAFNLHRKIAAWGALLFMSFFTALTLWIALFNPVNDCGCFGDVIKLSNWATFIKNIALMPFVVIYFLGRKVGKSADNRLYLIAIPLSFVLAIYSYFNLPLVDSTPYKIGVNIAEAMSYPEGAEQPDIHTTLIYKNIKSGDVREFEISDKEWQDSSQWEYIDSRNTVIKEGYEPPIKNLPMINSEGQDVAEEILAEAEEGNTLFVVTTDITRLENKKVMNFASELNAYVVILTSSPLEKSSYRSDNWGTLLNSDNTVINTMIQNSTGGALLLRNGTIAKKYVMRQLQ